MEMTLRHFPCLLQLPLASIPPCSMVSVWSPFPPRRSCDQRRSDSGGSTAGILDITCRNFS